VSDAPVTSGVTARRRIQNHTRGSVPVDGDLMPLIIQRLKTPTAVPSQTINGKNGNGNNGNKKPSCR